MREEEYSNNSYNIFFFIWIILIDNFGKNLYRYVIKIKCNKSEKSLILFIELQSIFTAISFIIFSTL